MYLTGVSLITSGHFYLGETGHYYLGLTGWFVRLVVFCVTLCHCIVRPRIDRFTIGFRCLSLRLGQYRIAEFAFTPTQLLSPVKVGEIL